MMNGRASHLLTLVLLAQCSLLQAMPSNLLKIIGGEMAQPGEFPFLVGIFFHGRYICGGSIIDEHHVITAAHCIMSDKVEVNYGSFNVNEGKVIMGSAIIHPRFQKGFFNDIALIRFETPFIFSSRKAARAVGAVSLPKSELFDPEANDTLVAVGRGWHHWNVREMQEEPWKVESVTVPLETCRETYIAHEKEKEKYPDIYESNICFGGANSNTCKGDSGGPLLMIRDGEPVLVGLTSWGIEGLPGVYVRVSHFLGWIEVAKEALNPSGNLTTLAPSL